jgi:ABC-type phosphate/phosphonate transport system substrate-binding protein
VHPGLDPEFREELRRAFVTLDAEERGRAVLARLGIDRFEAPTSEAESRPTSSGRRGW